MAGIKDYQRRTDRERSPLMRFSVRSVSFVLLLSVFSSLHADSRLGADKAMPYMTDFLETLPLVPGTVYELNEEETGKVIRLAADIHINVFEIIDCSFRYITPKNCRIRLDGALLRKQQSVFDLGGERVLAILAVDKIKFLETGASFTQDQHDLDIYLSEPAETYIEIGTAVYNTHFGFKKMSPLLFEDAFGISVKKLLFSAPLIKLKLFAAGKGEIYVKGVPRPKRWNLDVITYLD